VPEARIIHGDSRRITDLAVDLVGKVQLVVTSPPYHNAISYEGHAVDPSKNYRARDEGDYAGQYLSLLDEIWKQCHLMLRPGGVMAINVGTVLELGYQYPLPMDIEHRVLHSGEDWDFIGAIQWHKVTAGVKRAGSVIQQRLPGYWYPNIMTEHILLFSKGDAHKVARNQVPELDRPIWDIAPVPPGKIEHPAPFPEEIPHRLVKLFTTELDWVLDPFNGAGTTTKAAFDLNRNSLGFDLERRYVDYAKRRILLPSNIRQAQLSIHTEPASEYMPRKSKGRTRHGAGITRKTAQ
jgi:site-specific DNA-methyltransferase (adenine-specific)